MNFSGLVKYNPMRVSSYLSLPKELKEKQGCGVKHLVDMKDIDKFEQQNNISVNVYWFEDKKVFSLRITTVGIAKNCVNLLYITAGETSHYVCWKTWAKWYQHKIIITTTENVSGNIVHMTKPVKRYWKKKQKAFGKVQPTLGTKNQTLRTWWHEGAQQSQTYKNRIPTMFTFCHLCRFQKCFMIRTRLVWAMIINILHHPIPVSRTIWELHLGEMQWWAKLWTTSSKYRGWLHWKVFGPGLGCSIHL